MAKRITGCSVIRPQSERIVVIFTIKREGAVVGEARFPFVPQVNTKFISATASEGVDFLIAPPEVVIQTADSLSLFSEITVKIKAMAFDLFREKDLSKFIIHTFFFNSEMIRYIGSIKGNTLFRAFKQKETLKYIHRLKFFGYSVLSP